MSDPYTLEEHRRGVVQLIHDLQAENRRLKITLERIRDCATVYMGDYDIRVDGEDLESFINRCLGG